MSKLPLLRSSLLVSALGSALSAHAVGIGLSSSGTVAGSSIDETVLQQVGGYGPLATLHYVTVAGPVNALGGTLTATGNYQGAGGRLDFSMVFAQPVNNLGTGNYSGTWTATGGIGTYTAATGGGTFGLNVFGANSSFTIQSGNIEAVPEPAACAALGIGAVGLLRRRRS